MSVPKGSVPCPVAVKVVLALTTTPLTVHDQVSPGFRIPLALVSPAVGGAERVPTPLSTTTFGDVKLALPSFCSVTVSVTVPPAVTLDADELMVVFVLGLVLLIFVLARSC